jgi:hypothetical protein
MSVHSFGGAWTERKLSVVRRYLEIYAQALKNQAFQRVYIDALPATVPISGAKPSRFLIFPSLTLLRKDRLALPSKSSLPFIDMFSLSAQRDGRAN